MSLWFRIAWASMVACDPPAARGLRYRSVAVWSLDDIHLSSVLRSVAILSVAASGNGEWYAACYGRRLKL